MMRNLEIHICNMKRLGIIAALDSEFAQVAALLSNVVKGEINGLPFIEGDFGSNLRIGLAKSGIGKVCATVGTVELIKSFNPDFLINTGVAGGIDASLNVMDVVVSTQVAYHDVWCGEGSMGQVQGFPLYFDSCKELVDIALQVKGTVPVKSGLIVTGDQFISDKDQLAKIKSQFPQAMAVDMESAAIGHVCYMYNIPYMSFRIMSDTPGANEDNFSQYMDFRKSIADSSFAVCKSFLSELDNSL